MLQLKDKRMADGYKNQTHDMLPTRDIQTESMVTEKVFYVNLNEKKAEVAILISDKIYFKQIR